MSNASQVRSTFILEGVRRILDGVRRIFEGVHRILEGFCRILDGVCRILEGDARKRAPHTHSLCRRMRTALARHNACDAVVAEEAGKAVLEGRPAGWGGRWWAESDVGPGRVVVQGGMAGPVVGGGWIF